MACVAAGRVVPWRRPVHPRPPDDRSHAMNTTTETAPVRLDCPNCGHEFAAPLPVAPAAQRVARRKPSLLDAGTTIKPLGAPAAARLPTEHITPDATGHVTLSSPAHLAPTAAAPASAS